MTAEITNKLTDAMADVLKAVEPALQKISETLCVSIDAVRENAMTYIMMYGKYDLAKSITSGLGWTFGICLVVGFFIWMGFCASCSTDEEVKTITKPCIKYISLGFLIILAVVEFNICLPYLMSPEMYSINAVAELVKTQIQ